MGVRILYDSKDNHAALYCSVTDWAFGPVFTKDRETHRDADERAEAFCRWVYATHPAGARDPRLLSDAEMQVAYSAWLAQEAAQWQAEQEAEDAKSALLDD